jgi:hypothetical protein
MGSQIAIAPTSSSRDELLFLIDRPVNPADPVILSTIVLAIN